MHNEQNIITLAKDMTSITDFFLMTQILKWPDVTLILEPHINFFSVTLGICI